MEMDGELFIHVGLPKTATTFLQEEVYPRIENVAFLGKAKKLDFFQVYTEPREKFLISHEHLLACPFERYPNGWLGEFRTRLGLLAQRFPDARIMISFREHEALLTSYYKEYISKPGRPYLTLDEFFDVRGNTGLVRFEDLRYMDLIELIQSHFRQPVFAFLFEDVVHNLPVFLRDLGLYVRENVPAASEIKQSRVNPGVRHYQAKLLVRLNQLDGTLKKVPLMPGLYNPLFKKLSIHPDRLCRKHLAFLSKRPLRLHPHQQSFIRSYYEKDWADVRDYVARTTAALPPLDSVPRRPRRRPSIKVPAT